MARATIWLQPGVTYGLKVRGINRGFLAGEWSTTLHMTTEDSPTAPGGAISDVKDDYAAGDLDTEAELLAAANEIAGAVDAILAALRTWGIIET